MVLVMRIKIFFANLLFILCCFPTWIKFYLYINQISKIQLKILKGILQNNVNAKYGKKLEFSRINTYEDWSKLIPIIDYEDVAPFITDKNNLTTNKIKIFEPTSGSSGKQKLIPYTEELRLEFQKGIKVWLFDLYLHNPKLLLYKSYWSITPKTKTENSDVGFEKDEEYFSKIEQKFLEVIMIKPEMSENFLTNTKDKLIEEQDNIGLISIWSPTFMKAVLGDEIVNFKNLQIISCWADSSSNLYAKELQKQYCNCIVQPKGLLATEGITSFPLWNKGCVISYTSHFYEFKNEDGVISLISDLKVNNIYTVILTTSGGLYRYNTHDLVKVTGFYKKLPIIEFIGRDNNVSDFFGEKISEMFVAKIFEEMFISKPKFAILAFNKNRYTLFIDGKCNESVLENYLEKNYHYLNCIKLGQLKPCSVEIVNDGLSKYLSYYLSKGIKLGDIKIKTLDNNICDIFIS